MKKFFEFFFQMNNIYRKMEDNLYNGGWEGMAILYKVGIWVRYNTEVLANSIVIGAIVLIVGAIIASKIKNKNSRCINCRYCKSCNKKQ